MSLKKTDIIFSSFPKTSPPEDLSLRVVNIFKNNIEKISTISLIKGLESNHVLKVLKEDLLNIGFEVEGGKSKEQKIHRPVFFGENGQATVRYEIDAYHNEKKCGLEVEAGRAWKGNAVYRDLIISLLMIDLEHLILAVPQTYKYKSKGKVAINKDYEYTRNLVDNLYSHSRFKMPYNLTLIGY